MDCIDNVEKFKDELEQLIKKYSNVLTVEEFIVELELKKLKLWYDAERQDW